MNAEEKLLLEHAGAARLKAYAPYSHFSVGAAVLDENGDIHVGCNVENAAYPLVSCAEANAIAAMVAAGAGRIALIAIVGGHDGPEPCVPCGGCRQRIAEFADDNSGIIVHDENGDVRRYTVQEMLPAPFRLEHDQA